MASNGGPSKRLRTRVSRTNARHEAADTSAIAASLAGASQAAAAAAAAAGRLQAPAASATRRESTKRTRTGAHSDSDSAGDPRRALPGARDRADPTRSGESGASASANVHATAGAAAPTNAGTRAATARRPIIRRRPSARVPALSGVTSTSAALYSSLRSRSRAGPPSGRLGGANIASCKLPGVHFLQHSDIETVPVGIFNTLRRHELQYRGNYRAYDEQPGLEPYMRMMLLDWMMEVCQEYLLHRETYHLAVNFTDRYVSVVPHVPRSSLQLVGLVALFLASKIEEIYPPQVKDFAAASAGTYTINEVLSLEGDMIRALNWKLAPDTCLAWIVSLVQQVSLVINSDREVAPQDLPLSGPRDGAADNGSVVSNYRTELVERCMAVLDLCSLQMRFLRFRPRVLAAAALQTCCTRESEAAVKMVVKQLAVVPGSAEMDPVVLAELAEAEEWVLFVTQLCPRPLPHPEFYGLSRKHPVFDVSLFQTHGQDALQDAQRVEAAYEQLLIDRLQVAESAASGAGAGAGAGAAHGSGARALGEAGGHLDDGSGDRADDWRAGTSATTLTSPVASRGRGGHRQDAPASGSNRSYSSATPLEAPHTGATRSSAESRSVGSAYVPSPIHRDDCSTRSSHGSASSHGSTTFTFGARPFSHMVTATEAPRSRRRLHRSATLPDRSPPPLPRDAPSDVAGSADDRGAGDGVSDVDLGCDEALE